MLNEPEVVDRDVPQRSDRRLRRPWTKKLPSRLMVADSWHAKAQPIWSIQRRSSTANFLDGWSQVKLVSTVHSWHLLTPSWCIPTHGIFAGTSWRMSRCLVPRLGWSDVYWHVIIIAGDCCLFITMIRRDHLHPHLYLHLNLPPPSSLLPPPSSSSSVAAAVVVVNHHWFDSVASWHHEHRDWTVHNKRMQEIHMHATGCLSNLLDGGGGALMRLCIAHICTHPLTVSAQQTLFSRPLAIMKTPSRFFDPTGTRLPAWRKLCHKLVSWPGFDSFIGMIILANGLTIGDLEISTLEPLCHGGLKSGTLHQLIYHHVLY